MKLLGDIGNHRDNICGKCCGAKSKKNNAPNRRAQRRRERQEWKNETRI